MPTMKKNNKIPQKPTIFQALQKALLEDGEMNRSLYEYDMEEHIAFWTEGMKKDKNDLVFVVNENNNHIAMVLITKDEKLFINEEARAYLQKTWKKQYEKNIKMLLPGMVAELNEGAFPIHGVIIVD
jgi:hypothetical protein